MSKIIITIATTVAVFSRDFNFPGVKISGLFQGIVYRMLKAAI